MKVLKQAVYDVFSDLGDGVKKRKAVATHYKDLRGLCVALYNKCLDKMKGYRLERDGFFFADFIDEHSDVLQLEGKKSLKFFINKFEKKFKAAWLAKYVHHQHENDVKMPRKCSALDFSKRDNVIKRDVVDIVRRVYTGDFSS